MKVVECKNSKKNIVTKVLILVLAILFKCSIGIAIGNTYNTFCQSTVIGTDNSFHQYC